MMFSPTNLCQQLWLAMSRYRRPVVLAVRCTAMSMATTIPSMNHMYF